MTIQPNPLAALHPTCRQLGHDWEPSRAEYSGSGVGTEANSVLWARPVIVLWRCRRCGVCLSR